MRGSLDQRSKEKKIRCQKENVVCATTQVMSHFIDFQGTLKGGFKIYIDIYMF